MSATRSVSVSVTYKRGADARVHLSFSSQIQARAYCLILKASSFQKNLQLEPALENDDYSVHMRLPSRISEIRASSRLGGFNFIFSDDTLKKGWVKNMRLWDMDGDGGVFVKWDLSQRDLNKELGIREVIVTTPQRRPNNGTKGLIQA
ncbi:hypothetical protein PG996_005172 [Apiospora saccharicola]|uniref:Uncharacterized protein n=1 Tax=Apiospora saccharicola TaxID=335842 RepID=A0ABR1VPJ1_9PEZI